MGASRLRWPSLLMLVALAVGACSGSSSAQGTQTPTSSTATLPVPSSTSPSRSPSASRDPATAAKAAYVRYREAIDQAYGNPGGATRDRLSQVATNGRLTVLLSQVDALRKDRVHQQGSVKVKKMLVASTSPAVGKRLAQVFLDACLDYSQRTYVDTNGKPIFAAEKGTKLARASVNMILFKGQWLVADEKNPPVKSC
jgi:hypothetical protein